jgi:hypothetical protein
MLAAMDIVAILIGPFVGIKLPDRFTHNLLGA